MFANAISVKHYKGAHSLREVSVWIDDHYNLVSVSDEMSYNPWPSIGKL